MSQMDCPDPARRAMGPDAAPHPNPIVLWSVRGATDALRGLAIETSFGYALGLELDSELVLLHLQPSLPGSGPHGEDIQNHFLTV